MKKLGAILILFLSINSFANTKLSDDDWKIVRMAVADADNKASRMVSDSEGGRAFFGLKHRTAAETAAEYDTATRKALVSVGISNVDEFTPAQLSSLRSAAHYLDRNAMAQHILVDALKAKEMLRKGKSFGKGVAVFGMVVAAIGNTNAKSVEFQPRSSLRLNENTSVKPSGSFSSFGDSKTPASVGYAK